MDSSQVSFDLGNLCSYDAASLDVNSLIQNDEDYLYRKSRDNVQALVNQLFSCNVKVNAENNGLIARLPPPRTKFPREKRVGVLTLFLKKTPTQILSKKNFP